MKARKMTPKDFAPHLLAVIGELAENRPEVAVPMESTFAPVCKRMKIRVEDFGESEHGSGDNKTPWVHRQIGLAFRQLRDKGFGSYEQRGQWALTQAGIDELLSPEDAGAESEERDEKIVHLHATNSAHPYSDDPYIRGLAVEQTPCFGAYSVRSNVCKECRLSAECLVAVDLRKAEIAADLEREEIAARKAAEAKKKKKEQQDQSIDELMEAMGSDGSSGTGPKGRYKPPPDAIISTAFAQREGICAQCNEKVVQNNACVWIEGEGIFHPSCIELPPDFRG